MAFLPYSEKIILEMSDLIRNPTVDQVIKPAAILTLSDIALAIQEKFTPHLDMYLSLIIQASQIEEIEYIVSLHLYISLGFRF